MKSEHTIITLFLFLLTGSIAVGQPVINADGPLDFCYPESVTLCVEPEYLSYLWNTGSTEQCITILESGDYYAVVVDSLFSIDSSLVSVPTTVIIHRPQPIVHRDGDTLALTQPFDSYQWYLNGDSIQGANTGQYVIEEGGYYSVEVTDTNGCTGSVEGFVSPLGIDEIVENVDRLIIYPNPSISEVQLQFSADKVEHIEIQLFNAMGQSVLVLYKGKSVLGKNRFSFSCENLSQGVYFVQIESSEGTRTKKLTVYH